MEEPTKYVVNKEELSENELAAIKKTFQKAGRELVYFADGDVVITEENLLQKIGSEISSIEAMELLKKRSIKILYPVESVVVFIN